MKTEDKFLLSSGLSFLVLIIFEIIDFFVDTEVKWLNISLYITIFVFFYLTTIEDTVFPSVV